MGGRQISYPGQKVISRSAPLTRRHLNLDLFSILYFPNPTTFVTLSTTRDRGASTLATRASAGHLKSAVQDVGLSPRSMARLAFHPLDP